MANLQNCIFISSFDHQSGAKNDDNLWLLISYYAVSVYLPCIEGSQTSISCFHSHYITIFHEKNAEQKVLFLSPFIIYNPLTNGPFYKLCGIIF